jgi:hypothetical protein
MKFNFQIGKRKQKIRGQEARIDFSFKREVFFTIIGGFIGALLHSHSPYQSPNTDGSR